MATHKGEEMKGRVKEAAGNLLNDNDLKVSGKADQASAKTKEKIDRVADNLKDTFDRKR